MKNDPFSIFIQFIIYDNAWRAAQKELEAQDRLLNLLYDEQKDKQLVLSTFKDGVHTLFKTMQNYELESRTVRERMSEVQRKLEFVDSPREYTGLHKELDELRAKEKTSEESLFLTWQEHELRQSEYQRKSEEHVAWLKEYEQKVRNAEASKEAISSKVIDLEQERASFEKNVTPDFLSVYYDMKRSVPDPVVPVINNYCSACRCLVAQQDLASMRRHILVKCKECYRLLYLCS